MITKEQIFVKMGKLSTRTPHHKQLETQNSKLETRNP